LLKVLKSPTEDEIVKFYVVKTIENITSSSYSTGYKFATPELITPLV
jgi:serine/threonine-protein kinase ULK4